MDVILNLHLKFIYVQTYTHIHAYTLDSYIYDQFLCDICRRILTHVKILNFKVEYHIRESNEKLINEELYKILFKITLLLYITERSYSTRTIS